MKVDGGGWLAAPAVGRRSRGATSWPQRGHANQLGSSITVRQLAARRSERVRRRAVRQAATSRSMNLPQCGQGCLNVGISTLLCGPSSSVSVAAAPPGTPPNLRAMCVELDRVIERRRPRRVVAMDERPTNASAPSAAGQRGDRESVARVVRVRESSGRSGRSSRAGTGVDQALRDVVDGLRQRGDESAGRLPWKSAAGRCGRGTSRANRH